MSPKSPCALALSVLLLLAVPLLVPSASASAGGDYVSQLDANGAGLYEYLDTRFEELSEDPTDSVTISYVVADSPLFASMDEASEYASAFVHDTLAAYYLTNPYPIWLWDYPVTGADVIPSAVEPRTDEDGNVHYVLLSVTFTLTVPDGFGDDPETEENEISGYIAALDAEIAAYEGDSVEDIVSEISSRLSGVTSSDDDEGTVSNPYDALVTGTSSSAGVAAAFTLLCGASGVTAITAMGQTGAADDDGDFPVGYWNLVLMDDGWYAADCTLNGDDARNCLLVGTSTTVTVGTSAVAFGGTRSSVIVMQDEVSLTVPQIVYSGVEWPDDTSFIEAYGAYIALVVMMVIIVAALVHAIRSGNVR